MMKKMSIADKRFTALMIGFGAIGLTLIITGSVK